jgi:hypothetical protein
VLLFCFKSILMTLSLLQPMLRMLLPMLLLLLLLLPTLPMRKSRAVSVG